MVLFSMKIFQVCYLFLYTKLAWLSYGLCFIIPLTHIFQSVFCYLSYAAFTLSILFSYVPGYDLLCDVHCVKDNLK